VDEIFVISRMGHSDWGWEEVTLTASRLDDRDNRLERLGLVRVGHASVDRIQVMLQPDRLTFLHLDPGPLEQQLELLIIELRQALRKSAPSLRRSLAQYLLALEPNQENLSKRLQDRVLQPLPALPGIPGE
jgi:hypothetical protein